MKVDQDMMKSSASVESGWVGFWFGGREAERHEESSEDQGKRWGRGDTDLLILLVLEKKGNYLCPWEEEEIEFSRSTTEACVESFCVRQRLTFFR